MTKSGHLGSHQKNNCPITKPTSIWTYLLLHPNLTQNTLWCAVFWNVKHFLQFKSPFSHFFWHSFSLFQLSQGKYKKTWEEDGEKTRKNDTQRGNGRRKRPKRKWGRKAKQEFMTHTDLKKRQEDHGEWISRKMQTAKAQSYSSEVLGGYLGIFVINLYSTKCLFMLFMNISMNHTYILN